MRRKMMGDTVEGIHSEWRDFVPLLLVCVLAVTVLALGVPVGDVAAVSTDYDDDEIVETQTISTEGTETGEMRVEIQYHLGDEIVEFDTIIWDPYIEVLELDGFTQIGPDQFEWDEQTTNPSVTLLASVDTSRSLHGGPDFAETSEWLLTASLRTDIGWATIGFDPDDIEVTRQARGEMADSISGQRMLFAGEYDRQVFQTDTHTFEVIVPQVSEPARTSDEIGETLVRSTEMLDVTDERDEITTFVAPDPIRVGGMAIGPDFWVHEHSLDSVVTLVHEYVHTQQVKDTASSAEWTIEAEAEYYSFLLGMKQGELEYHEFYDIFDDADETFPDAVLADEESWVEDWLGATRADYDLGALTLANLDAEIRAHSDNTYEDVFRMQNEYDDHVDDETLETKVSDVSGLDFSDFFDRHIRSTPDDLSLPAPTVYEGPNVDSNLELTVQESSLEPGDDGSIGIEVTNTGAETSLAPLLELDDSGLFDESSLEVDDDAGVTSEITRHDEGWVFDHLSPDETLVLEYEGATDPTPDRDTYGIDVAIEDMSGTQAEAVGSVRIGATPTAQLDLPAGLPAGTELVFDGTGSSDETGIESFTWEITGPEEHTEETISDTYARTFDEPGTYEVTLIVENAEGMSDSVTRTVVVSDQPTLTVDAPDRVDAGETFTAEAHVENEFGTYEVTWELGDDTATGDILELTLQTTGERDLLVTVEDEYGAQTTETVTITVGDDDGEETEADDGLIDDALGPGFGPVTAFIGLVVLLLGVRLRRQST